MFANCLEDPKFFPPLTPRALIAEVNNEDERRPQTK